MEPPHDPAHEVEVKEQDRWLPIANGECFHPVDLRAYARARPNMSLSSYTEYPRAQAEMKECCDWLLRHRLLCPTMSMCLASLAYHIHLVPGYSVRSIKNG